MTPPVYLLCIPGVALLFLIQSLLCKAYYCHVTVQKNKYTKTSKSNKRRTKANQVECRKCKHYKTSSSSQMDQQSEDSDEFITEGPKDRSSLRSRRKSVFAESYDPAKDASIEKIVNPKTSEERQWLIDNVRNVTLFQHLADDQVMTVVDAMYKCPVERDDVIMREGDKGCTFYIIQTGVYRVYKRESEDSASEKLVHTYDNQGSFGELALLYNQPRAATVISNTEGVLWAVDGVTFRRIVNRISYKKRTMYEGLINSVLALKALEPHERANLVDVLTPLNFQNNEQIIKQGDEANGMYFIISGGVKIVVKTPQGKQILLKELSSGEYFGELALLTNNRRAASVYAVGPTHLAFLERQTFERLLGPCMDILRRGVDDYSSKLSEIFKHGDI